MESRTMIEILSFFGYNRVL